MTELESQQRINFNETDPRSLTTEQVKRLRILPVGKRLLDSTRDGDFRPMGFVLKKEDDDLKVKGEINLNGGYYILEITGEKRAKIGNFVLLTQIPIRSPDKKKSILNPNRIISIDRSDVKKPKKLIDTILKERD